MARRPMNVLLVLAFLLVALLLVAWYDGGREPQRLIVEDVTLPETPQ